MLLTEESSLFLTRGLAHIICSDHRFINLDRIFNSKTADNHVEDMESAVLFESLTQLNTSRQAFLSCLHFIRGVAESV